MTPSPDVASARARSAAYQRHRAPDDPDLVTARRDLAAVTLEQHVRKIVEAAPPLTDEQRERIAALLRPELARRAEDGGAAA